MHAHKSRTVFRVTTVSTVRMHKMNAKDSQLKNSNEVAEEKHEGILYRRRAATPKAPKRAPHAAPNTRNESASLVDFLPVAEAAAAEALLSAFPVAVASPICLVCVGIVPMSWVKMLFALCRLSSMKLRTSDGIALYLISVSDLGSISINLIHIPIWLFALVL